MLSSSNFTSIYPSPQISSSKITLSSNQVLPTNTDTKVLFTGGQNGLPRYISSVSAGDITFAEDGSYLFTAYYTISTDDSDATTITFQSLFTQTYATGDFATAVPNPIQAMLNAEGTFLIPATLPFGMAARAGDKLSLNIKSSALTTISTVVAANSYLLIAKVM